MKIKELFYVTAYIYYEEDTEVEERAINSHC